MNRVRYGALTPFLKRSITLAVKGSACLKPSADTYTVSGTGVDKIAFMSKILRAQVGRKSIISKDTIKVKYFVIYKEKEECLKKD